MGWVKVAKPPHVCKKPQGNYEPGSIWQCDDCGQHWLYKERWGGPVYWTDDFYWKKISKAKVYALLPPR